MIFTPITKRTRCGQHGRLIRCPHCHSVARVYHLSWSALWCSSCDRTVDKFDWSIGPNVTQQELRPKNHWCVVFPGHRVYGPTKAEVLRRAKNSIERAKQRGQDWSVIREPIPGWTLPPTVLVFDRNHEKAVNAFNEELKAEHGDLYELSGVDWCGSRVVYGLWRVGEQIDFPFEIYRKFRQRLKDWNIEPDLCMLREDPGLGIYLPEIDDELLEALTRIKAETTPAIA